MANRQSRGLFTWPDATTVAAVDAIHAAIPKIEYSLPSGLQITTLNDSSVLIYDAVADVQKSRALTISLVIPALASLTVTPMLAASLSHQAAPLVRTLGLTDHDKAIAVRLAGACSTQR